MVSPARLAVVVALLCALLAAPALAQRPFSSPTLRNRPKGGFSAHATATPTASPTASPTPSPSASPQHHRAGLPNTGADPLRLALAGLALLGFGYALRYRVALADARLPH